MRWVDVNEQLPIPQPDERSTVLGADSLDAETIEVTG